MYGQSLRICFVWRLGADSLTIWRIPATGAFLVVKWMLPGQMDSEEYSPVDYLRINPKLAKDMEEWEEEDPTGTRVLKKLAKNRRKRKNDD